MPEAFILEFDGFGKDTYLAVNERLGIDPATGEGDWPTGLLSHVGAAKPDGWVVFEIWESQDAQARFMDDRLGAALQEAGVTAPPARAEWLDVAGWSTHDG
jgi:hypothetical protein